MAILGAGLGGSLALASMIRRDHPTASNLAVAACEPWGLAKGALAGVTTTRLGDFIGETIPGFSERFRERTVEKAGEPR